MHMLKLSLVIISTLLISACANKVSYGDATEVETVTVDFGSTDLQAIAATLVDDLLSFPPVEQMTATERPIVFVDRINNKTTEHIDTESITDTIMTKLIKSGKFRFVDMTAVQAMREQFSFQQDGGLVDPAKAVAFGKQSGAELMLYGNLASIVKRADDTKDVYYKFTLKLMNLETGILEWAGEKEIRKQREKSLFGL